MTLARRMYGVMPRLATPVDSTGEPGLDALT
jgi:hypothetical protein